MYRAEPPVNERLLDHFKLKDIKNNCEVLFEKIGADNFFEGETLEAFISYLPKYIDPAFNTVYEINLFFIWSIRPVEMKLAGTTDIVFHEDPPLGNADNISDLPDYRFPKMEWFDFNNYKIITDAIFKGLEKQKEIKANNIKRFDKYFLNTYCMNSIFMTSIFIRGINKMFMELAVNEKYAEVLIGKIGEFILEFCTRNLQSIGDEIDLYGIRDDFATQDGLMISREIWQKFYKLWHKKIIDFVKNHGLLIVYHVCGNCSEVIPGLIEMGVDILDPGQVSSRDMEISSLKKQFGKDICFHSGVDAQKLLPFSSPEEIRKEIRRIRSIFNGEGGIILGPSHYITTDTPTEDILAIYN